MQLEIAMLQGTT